VVLAAAQDKANLERQLKQLNSKSTLLEKNLEKKDAQVTMQGSWGSLGLNPCCLYMSNYMSVCVLAEKMSATTQTICRATTHPCS
jgi:hypothetical protein